MNTRGGNGEGCGKVYDVIDMAEVVTRNGDTGELLEKRKFIVKDEAEIFNKGVDRIG